MVIMKEIGPTFRDVLPLKVFDVGEAIVSRGSIIWWHACCPVSPLGGAGSMFGALCSLVLEYSYPLGPATCPVTISPFVNVDSRCFGRSTRNSERGLESDECGGTLPINGVVVHARRRARPAPHNRSRLSDNFTVRLRMPQTFTKLMR